MQGFAKVCPRCGRRYDAAASFCQKDGVPLLASSAGEAEAPDPWLGQVLLDQFRIEERIGAGGMGAVYRARQTSVDRDVAIKLLLPDLMQNPDAVRRFHREARVSTALDHPHVVRVMLFGELADGSLYLVMELLRGRSLAELLRVEGSLSVERALHIATQACDGVGEAHGHGIVHRDVKPENVFLVQKGGDPDYVKVLDFGIARLETGGDASQATQSGLVFGTARYISPEGAAGEPADARSDVYSLGVMLYQMLCGETPFDAPTPVTLLMKHVQETPPDLRSRPGGRGVPDVVAGVVMRALSKDPDRRPANAPELAAQLRAAMRVAGMEAPDPYDTARMRPSARVGPRTRVEAEDVGDEAGVLIASRARGRRVATAASGALLLVALAGGAFVALRANLGAGDRDDPASLVRRAEAALAAGRFDAEVEGTPEGEHVAALTDALARVQPTTPDLARLRQAAARGLCEAGVRAGGHGAREAALAFHRRAAALSTAEPCAREGIARFSGPSPAPAARLEVEPAPVAGAEVVLVVRGVQVAPGAAPRFEVVRVDRRVVRRVEASPGPEEGTWTAAFTFSASGSHDVRFVTGPDRGRIDASAVVEVGRAPRLPSRPEAPPVTTLGASAPSAPVAPRTATATQAGPLAPTAPAAPSFVEPARAVAPPVAPRGAPAARPPVTPIAPGSVPLLPNMPAVRVPPPRAVPVPAAPSLRLPDPPPPPTPWVSGAP